MRDIWSNIARSFQRYSYSRNGNRIQRYGLVLILTGVLFLIKTTLSNFVGQDVPFLFGLFIVIISAWYGGLRPGIFATILTGFLTNFFFLEPKLTFFNQENTRNLIITAVFFVEGIIISLISESHRSADRQKNQFIGVISHELKNPLTSIKGYADLIRKLSTKNGDERLADFALRIDRQINHVVEMVNEMLDVAKIETGRFTYQDEPFMLIDLIKEVIADQQVTTDTHKIVFTGTGKHVVVGDRYRIGQVITNLISNAIKYSPNAKEVLVKLMNKKSMIEITVQDFGPGISKDDQRRLFRPYFRAKNTQSAKGTGIGLFISSQIIQRHSGRIGVKSTLGKGSRFYVTLPVLPSATNSKRR